MQSILEAYTARFGSAVHKHPSSWNGPCPLCGGEAGRSDRFMLWQCTAEQEAKLGGTCREHHITLAWHCRRCGAGGDSIAYYQQVEGMSFRDACDALGIMLEPKAIEGGKRRLRRRTAPQESAQAYTGFMPKSSTTPKAEDPEKWMSYAEKMLAEGQEAIFSTPAALAWLAQRGIDAAAIRAYGLGYRTPEGSKTGRYRYRTALGLGQKTAKDGHEVTKIFLPRGILIPTFRTDGRLINIRTRKHNADVLAEKVRRDGKSEKYLSLEGGADPTFVLQSTQPEHLATYFIVEAELDAMLVHHISGGFVGAVAIRSNRNKPDAVTHALLSKAARVAVALDFDPAGTEGVEWWLERYATAVRWPVPEGKDPGDYFGMGGDVRQWLRACLPLSSAVQSPQEHGGSIAESTNNAQPEPASGSVEMNAGQSACGGKGERHCKEERQERKMTVKNEPSAGYGTAEQLPLAAALAAAPKSAFTPQELRLLAAALPAQKSIEDIPQDVCRAWLLWRGLPIRFEKLGGGGWQWVSPTAWRRANREAYEAFASFQDSSRALWQWMSAHSARVITWRNLLGGIDENMRGDHD